jgi:hypothetical protein
MAVIDLEAWRREHGWGGPDGRLQRAIDRLDAAVASRGWSDDAPPWLVTELLAVQGCLSIGMATEAARRVERLAQRVDSLRTERRRVGR